MVTTSTAAVSATATITNNGNMLLYTSNNPNLAINNSINNNNNSTTLEQYRLQLYNYALNMERLRGPPYTAAAMAAAAAYASATTVATTSASGQSVHGGGSNYTSPAPPAYLCATANGLMAGPTTTLAQCPTSNRLALASMSLFPQRIFQPEEPKPQHSYIGLIAMAILSSAETKLVLSDIYQYILDNYPYFRTRGPGWRNSIRHNLSLNDCFIKSGRSANGKGHYWAIHPANMEDFRKGDFRRRKAQRKVRKHMGLAVDDNGTDSPSPPPAMDLTSPSPPSFQQHCASVMGSTITPLATAAQQLAAHSFGWRFTHHHHHHHHQQRPPQHHAQTATHTPAATAASYIGQIFTCRPQQQNSITTHYAAAAAAAALCNSGGTQQHHHQQQLHVNTTSTTTNHHQQQIENSLLNQKNPQTTAFIPCTSASPASAHNKLAQQDSAPPNNVISQLFSQKRKRLFDVASLLAPDNSHKREQQPYLGNDKSQSPLIFHDDDDDENPISNDLDIEDIDVVEASEDEDIEADYEQDEDEEDSNCNSHNHSHDEEESDYARNHGLKNHCKTNKLQLTEDKTRIIVQEYEAEEEDDGEKPEHEHDEPENYDYDDECSTNNNNNIKQHEHISNNNNSDSKNISIFKQNPAVSAYEFITNSENQSNHAASLRVLKPPTLNAPNTIPAIRSNTTNTSPPTLTTSLEIQDPHQNHHQTHNQLPLNDAHHLFGRYYGTYMAAAAAARINSSIPANLVENID